MSEYASYFQDPVWLKAYTLTERSTPTNFKEGTSDAAFNFGLATRRVNRWRSREPFTDHTVFAQRLQAFKLSEAELSYLLGESLESLSQRLPVKPEWLITIEQAYACFYSDSANSSSSACEQSPLAGLPPSFLNGFDPLLYHAIKRLQDGLSLLEQEYPAAPFNRQTIKSALITHLFEQLAIKCARTMVLELNVARLQGELVGDTPEERFCDFAERLRKPEVMLPILMEYPVLARQIVTTVDNWVAFCLELFEHLCEDWEAIRTTFSPATEPGLISQVHLGAGDTHRGGRSVAIVTFDSGLRIVYKPRSLSTDVHYNQLLEWLNQHGVQPQFRILNVITGKAHGWAEFVQSQGCSTEEEIDRFYRRQGGYLALLYALEATDFPRENLIASGEHPILVDLEALFHPRLKTQMSGPQNAALADSAMEYSVLRVGLLPRRVMSYDDIDRVDLSGLGGRRDQLTPLPVISFENRATDEMHVSRKRVEMPGSLNRPLLLGADVNVQDYTASVIEGFTSVYRLLMTCRDELLAGNGPFAAFADDEVRAVLRQTQLYGSLLHESHHPDVLRDAVDRDILFDRLWMGIDYLPYISKIVDAEISDLLRGDIPVFLSRPNSRDLWTSREECVPEFFEESSLDVVSRRLRELNEDDLSLQAWFIKASMSTLSIGHAKNDVANPGLNDSPEPATRERLLAAARAVGDRLEVLALQDEHNVNWVGLTAAGERTWTLMPLAEDLYNGNLGVCLFLAYLGQTTGEERYIALARKVLMKIPGRVKKIRARVNTIGAFNGLGGLIYTLAHTGALWDETSLIEAAEELVSGLPELIDQDKTFDIIVGSAGCIGGLLSLYHCTASPTAFNAAVQCAEHLLTHARSMKCGIGWETTSNSTAPLTGFSHGASGIACALLDVMSLTGDLRFKTAALQAFTYERSVFSTSEMNWPDFRAGPAPHKTHEEHIPSFMCAWCHGAPGIGRARLRALEHFDDAAVRADLDYAVKTTLAQGFGHSHSLCHGDLGNLEFLMETARRLHDSKLLEHVNQIAASILLSIEKHGWLCGTPLSVETPGLMTGLAGIGFGLLRLAEPVSVPSVLSLAPPRALCE
ncbi:MAG TPA: type 2 lanthipeptide synthetase LanM family protein [Pyrinomonadaceae bacterium]